MSTQDRETITVAPDLCSLFVSASTSERLFESCSVFCSILEPNSNALNILLRNWRRRCYVQRQVKNQHMVSKTGPPRFIKPKPKSKMSHLAFWLRLDGIHPAWLEVVPTRSLLCFQTLNLLQNASVEYQYLSSRKLKLVQYKTKNK